MARGFGGLPETVVFDPPLTGADRFGVAMSGWDTANSVTRRAGITHRGGSEVSDGGGQHGKAVVKVKLHQSEDARAITPAWRMRHLRGGLATEYQVLDVDAVTSRVWIWITAERGGAM